MMMESINQNLAQLKNLGKMKQKILNSGVEDSQMPDMDVTEKTEILFKNNT
jgi:hypothetical protein